MANNLKLTGEKYTQFFKLCYGSTEENNGYVKLKVKGKNGRMVKLANKPATQIPETVAGLEFGDTDYMISKARLNAPKKGANKKNTFGFSNVTIHVEDTEAKNKIDAAIGTSISETLIADIDGALAAEGIAAPCCVSLNGDGFILWFGVEPCQRIFSAYAAFAIKACDIVRHVIEANREYARFHVDTLTSVSCEGIVRLPGTYNTKVGMTTTLIVRNGNKVNLWDYFTPTAKKEEKEEKGHEPNPADTSDLDFIRRYKREDRGNPEFKYDEGDIFAAAASKNGPTAFFYTGKSRMGRLIRLIDYRKGHGADIGDREDILFVAASTLIGMASFTEKDLIGLVGGVNSHFGEPLGESAVRSAVRYAMGIDGGKPFRFTNAGIIERLNVTKEEQAATGIKADFNSGNRFGKRLPPEEARRRQEEYNARMCAVRDYLAGHPEASMADAADFVGMNYRTCCAACKREGIRTQKMINREKAKEAIKKGKTSEYVEKHYGVKKGLYNTLCKEIEAEKAEKEAVKAEAKAKKKEEAKAKAEARAKAKEEREKAKAEAEREKAEKKAAKENDVKTAAKKGYKEGTAPADVAAKFNVPVGTIESYYSDCQMREEESEWYRKMYRGAHPEKYSDEGKAAKIETLIGHMASDIESAFTSQILKSARAIEMGLKTLAGSASSCIQDRAKECGEMLNRVQKARAASERASRRQAAAAPAMA